MKMKSLSVILFVVLIVSVAALYAGEKVILPTDRLVPTEFAPDNTKPGGVVIGPSMGRAFHYGGRHAVRDKLNRLHVGWEDPGYDFNYYAHSTDTLGYAWTEPYDPIKKWGVEEPGVGFRTDINRTLMPKMAIDPVSGYLYVMPFYRINAGERYKTGISRSKDNGETWTHYVDLGSRIDRSTEEVSWGTMTIDANQILHIAYAKDNVDIMYTRAYLAGLDDIDDIAFFKADSTDGDEAVSFVPSGVVFQGTIVVDRNNNPHIIFSGDGGSDTFGDKTPYHIYYKSAANSWGPIPPQQLMAELENIWGMPEMVFDKKNRGYYFFCDNSVGEIVFGTWEPPVDSTSATDFGTLNGTATVRDNSGASAVSLTVDNYANIEITTDDDLYLPNADVDDANDIVYLVANTNSYNGGVGGDIVVVKLDSATTYDGKAPAEMDWTLMRWITDDGVGLGDVGPDVIYDPSSSTLDVFWSGAGPVTQEAQYFPAHIPKSAIDAQASTVFIGVPNDRIYVNEGDVLTLNGIVKNNGTTSLGPISTILSILDAGGATLYTLTANSPPLAAGAVSTTIEFGTYTVVTSRQVLSLTLKVDYTGDAAPFNDAVGTSFFVYPTTDVVAEESFQDTNYANFPTFEADGTRIDDGGVWFNSTNEVGGWTVVDNSNGPFNDARDDYISTWFLVEPTEDDYGAGVRHLRGVRGDTLFGDIELGDLSDAAYAQPQNEVLLSPIYTITSDAYVLEWNDNIDGTDGADNFPVYAWVDYTVDGGESWLPVWHRTDTEGEGTNIAEGGAYVVYEVSDQLAGASTIQFRFWWRNENNDGSYATWDLDNIHFTEGEVAAVAVEGGNRTLPKEFALAQNYPNPFNPTTLISYSVPYTSRIELSVYNILGQRVTTLIAGEVMAGNHQVGFDASRLASGVYFYTLQTEGFSTVRKMLVLK